MKARPKRILIVTSEFPPLPGGIGNHALNLATHLEYQGYNVQVLADQRTKDSEESEFDERLKFQVHRIALKRFRLMMYIDRIHRLINLMKSVDLIFASGKFSLWNVAFVSNFFRKSTVAIIHGSEVNFKNRPVRWSINRSIKRFNSVIAVSKFTKNLVSHLELNALFVIPNGFDASEWQEHPDTKIDLAGNPKLITVGNVTMRKGQLNVINHFPHALKKFPDLHYHCVGFPTEKKEFLARAEQLGVKEHLTFHGRVSHDQLADYLMASDIFVMLSSATSTGDVEGFGIAILEANYLGLPAIGSSGCGIEDAIDHKSSGILIEPHNQDQFLESLQTIMNNRKYYSENAQNWAIRYTWEKVISSYIDIIEAH